MTHEGPWHLEGRCPKGGKHACSFIDQFVLENDGAGGRTLVQGKRGPMTLSEKGLPPFHGCSKCGRAAPDPAKEIRFYKAVGEHGFLSNLWRCPVTFEGIVFDSSEAAYQYGKPKDPKVREWLAKAPYPRLTAFVGHSLNVKYDVVPGWNPSKRTGKPGIKFERMRAVVLQKFLQNPSLAEKLKATGDKQLLEVSKTDSTWGTGKNGDGKNMLGVILMETRAKIQGGTK